MLVSVQLLCFGVGTAAGLGSRSYVETSCSPGCFTVASKDAVATIYADELREPPGVLRAASDLQSDIRRVTSQFPALVGNSTAIHYAVNNNCRYRRPQHITC